MKVMPNDLNAFRLIYGEADFLSGLTVDKFNDVLVCQILSLGIDVRKDVILKALYDVVSEYFKVRGIYLRCDVALREKEGLEEYVGKYDYFYNHHKYIFFLRLYRLHQFEYLF